MVIIIKSKISSDIHKSRFNLFCPSAWKRAKVQGMTSTDLQPEGTKLWTLSRLQRFGQGLSCSFRLLVCQSAVIKDLSVQDWRMAKKRGQVQYLYFCIVFSMVSGSFFFSTSKRFIMFLLWNYMGSIPLKDYKPNHCERPGDSLCNIFWEQHTTPKSDRN